MSKKVRLFAISMVGAGLALFLRHELGVFSELQNWFDGEASHSWSTFASVFGAFCGGLTCFGLEQKIKRMAFGESAILVWLSVFLLCYVGANNGVYGIPATSFSLAMLCSTFGLYAARSIFEEDGRLSLARAFRAYVSPALVEELERNPERLKVESERKNLTILFSDIQNFTALSEKLSPEELMSVLNRYFGGVTEIIFKHGGTLDKYMGDGVMAFWGAPTESVNHQKLATLAAIEIDGFSKKFFTELTARTGIELSTRVGLNSGEVHVGNFGSDMRFTYTAVGDEANLAARVEPLNTRYGTQVLITGSTARACKDLPLQFVDEVRVKGRAKPVAIYTPDVSLFGETQRSDIQTRYEKAFAIYRRGDFQAARLLFTELRELHPQFQPAAELVKRCEELSANSPEKWDGHYTFQDKK